MVIGATGQVVAANQSAREFFVGAQSQLVGTALSAFWVRRSEQSDDEAAWAELRASLNCWVDGQIRSQSGRTHAARLRLERAHGGAGSYLATVVIDG